MNHTKGALFGEAAERAVARSARKPERELTPADRRRFARFACPPKASVRLQSGVPARLLDLGLGGVLVESSMRLAPGSVTAIIFDTPDVAVRARARVSRASVVGFAQVVRGETPLLYRAGLEFEPLSPAEAGAVETLVSEAARATERENAERCPEVDPAVQWGHARLVTEAPASPTQVAPTISAPDIEPASTAIQLDRLVSIRFPPGWAMTRRKCAVVARAPDKRGYVFLGMPPGPLSRNLCEFARASMQEAGFSLLHDQPAEINGFKACVGFYTGWLHDVGAVIVEAAHVVLNAQAYLIAGVAPWATYEMVRHEFFATINSFGAQPFADGACLVAAPPSALPPHVVLPAVGPVVFVPIALDHEPRIAACWRSLEIA